MPSEKELYERLFEEIDELAEHTENIVNIRKLLENYTEEIVYCIGCFRLKNTEHSESCNYRNCGGVYMRGGRG